MCNLIELNKNNWFLEIDLNGGRIKELKYNNQTVIGTFERIDGKTGNTHICTPNFGNEGMEKYNLPFHGPARSGIWEVKNKNESSIIINYEFKEVGSYPGNMYIEQEFKLDKEFTQKITIKNIGLVEAPVNMGIHNYWNSPEGWNGVKINNVDVTNLVENDTYFKMEKTNEILIPGLEKMYLELNDFDYARLWSGRKEIEGNLIFDRNYVCIEPCIGKEDYFGSEESILKAGESKILSQVIKI
jgi:galactose mutarotase-like enzyme